MKIGVFVDGRAPHIGGGYAYSRTLSEFFASLQSIHEFIFIVASERNELPEGFQFLKNFVLYNPYESEKQKSLKIESKRKLKSLSRWHRISTFLAEKMRVSIFQISKEFIERRIRSCEQFEYKDIELFREIVQANKIDCVYYPMAFVCEDMNIPFYMTIWDSGHLELNLFPEVSKNNEFETREDFIKKVIHRAYRIVVESEAGKRNICFYYNVKSEKVIVLPQFPSSGILDYSDDILTSSLLKKFGIKDKDFLFYPAQFWPHKNHINLFKAIEKLKNEGIIIDLVLVGSDKGNLQYTMKYAISSGLGDQIKYLGFVSDAEMAFLYSHALALVFPSLLGPTNMPIVEAISYGCPVICSDFEGHREQAGEGALYFNPLNVHDMKEKIKGVIKNETIRSKLIEGGLIAFKGFTMQKATKILLESFEEFDGQRICWEGG